MASSPDVKLCVIIGSGPAGHTAAIYAARANMKPEIYEGMMAGGIAPGGQLTTTGDVENFPGFPAGIPGGDLCENFRKQSARFGTVQYQKTISKIDLSSRPFKLWCEDEESEAPILAHTLIIATGATAKKLPIPGADKYWQKGISACAVCDGALPIFRQQEIAVIGGGDSACEEAMHLTKYGKMVHLIHRRNELRASKVMQQRVKSNPKITIHWDSVPIECYGERLLQGLKLQDINTKAITDLPCRGMFFAVGHHPNTDFLKGQGVVMDEDGYIKTTPGSSLTTVEGLFAAGDCQDKRYRQAITAAGTGCMAALDCEHYLSTKGLLL